MKVGKDVSIWFVFRDQIIAVVRILIVQLLEQVTWKKSTKNKFCHVLFKLIILTTVQITVLTRINYSKS